MGNRVLPKKNSRFFVRDAARKFFPLFQLVPVTNGRIPLLRRITVDVVDARFLETLVSALDVHQEVNQFFRYPVFSLVSLSAHPLVVSAVRAQTKQVTISRLRHSVSTPKWSGSSG